MEAWEGNEVQFKKIKITLNELFRVPDLGVREHGDLEKK